MRQVCCLTVSLNAILHLWRLDYLPSTAKWASASWLLLLLAGDMTLSGSLQAQCASGMILNIMHYSCDPASQTYDVTFSLATNEALTQGIITRQVTSNKGMLIPECEAQYDPNNPSCDQINLYSSVACACDGRNHSPTDYVDFYDCTGLLLTSNEQCDGTIPVNYTITGVPLGQSVTVTTSLAIGSWPDLVFNFCNHTNVIPSPPVPPQPSDIGGKVNVCSGEIATYSVTASPNAVSYTWEVPAGFMIVSGQGNNSIQVKAGSTGGDICVTAEGACASSAPRCKTLTVNASPMVQLGAGPTCSSPSVTLDAANSGATYKWNTGLTTQTLTVNTTGVYTVTVTNAQACTASASASVVIQPAIQVGNISSNNLSGSFTLTGGLSQTNGSNYASVTMTLQGNPAVTATLTTAPFTHNETVSFTCPQAGTYTVTATDEGGCSGTGTVVVTGGGGCWIPQTSSTTNLLASVHFTDAQTGWAVGWNGTILKTVNGGNTWMAQSSGTTRLLYSVHFIDAQTGWAVGESGTILKTVNGGISWVAQISGTTDPLTAIHFIDGQIGWAVGALTILKTVNGGNTWTAQTSGVTTGLWCAYFTDPQTGWVAGDWGRILKTSNGGTTWAMQTSGMASRLNALHFLDGQTGWAVGQSSDPVLKTINGGNTWTAQNSGTSNGLLSVHFNDPQTGWAVGFSGTIIKTVNGGSTWTVETSGTLNALYSIHFTNAQTGWAVGSNGTILKYSAFVPSCLPTIPLHQQTNVPTTTAITWPNAPGCEDAYRLSLGTTPGGSDLLNSQIVADTFYQPAQPLPAGQTIYVRVVPYNGAGEATGCGEFSFVTAGGAFLPNMIPVPGGTFNMGCFKPNTVCDPKENPVHPVTLPDFKIGKYEVTQAEWASVMADISPDTIPSAKTCGGTCPMEKVTWYGAVVFCNRLSEQNNLTPCYFADAALSQVFGKNGNIWSLPNSGTVHWKKDADGYRLPTEAEWEYAARGGTQSQGFRYAGGNGPNAVAWHKAISGGKPHPVGTRDPNELGLYDMSGNVWELCWDWYLTYNSAAACSPIGPGTGIKRMSRGGSFDNLEDLARVSYRPFFPEPNNGVFDIGFRLAQGKVLPNCTNTLVQPAHAATNVPTNTVLRWASSNVCASGYRLSLGTTPGGSDILNNVAVADTFYQPALPLPAGQQVYVRVLPYNEAGEASGCGEFSFVTVGGMACPSDSLSLVDFYNATDGPNWTNKWNLNTPVKTWYGIITNAQGCVTKIDLDGIPNGNFSFGGGNNLTGTLPAQIGQLSELQTFCVAHNKNLTGSLPTQLGNLSKLQYFYAHGAGFSGAIPARIGNLKELIYLQLGFNNLSGAIPAEIGGLPKLVWLNLMHNNLSGTIPPTLGDLANLEQLWLFENQLTGSLPAELGKLKKLTRFWAYSNQLSGSIPPQLGQLTNLRRLYLHNNQLSGCFPSELDTFCYLDFSTNIDADGYNFTNNQGLPWMGDFQRFCGGTPQQGAYCNDGNDATTYDSIGANCVCAGVILCNPVSDSLELVKLYNATGGPNWKNKWDLSKPMKTWYGVTVNAEGCVTRLDLGNNNLKGNLIDFDLPNLQTFWCYFNQLSGGILDFSKLPSLQDFECSNNQLSGSIPDFSKLPNLRVFYCFSNQLSGSIPDFSNLPKLEYFLCYSNQLSGSIPDFSNLPKLQVFSCYSNQFTFENILPPKLLIEATILSNCIPGPVCGYYYSPQAPIFHDTLLLRAPGQNLDFSLDFDEAVATNVYKWYKDGIYQPTQDQVGNNNLIINNLQASHAGQWTVQVTNPSAPDLTLYSRTITLQVGVSACTTVTTTTDSGPGSLREAINCANANPGPDTIRFDIAGAGPHILSLASPLPQVTHDSLIIDATTQPGWSLGQVVVDGSGMSGQQTALLVAGVGGPHSGFQLYGLTMRYFPGTALGLNDCQQVVIGAPGKGNAFYGNAVQLTQGRVQVVLQGVSNGSFQGNIVGVTEDFNIPNSTNTITGLGGEMRDFLIGGNRDAGEGNVIGHSYYGINLWDNLNSFSVKNIRILGNDIGIAPNEAAIGNAEHGISVNIPMSSIGVKIGDGTAPHRNRIFHSPAGVYFPIASGVDIWNNEFVCNVEGINNAVDDPQAPDVLQATPQGIQGTGKISGRVEVYAHRPCGNVKCQGATYMGSTTANASGDWVLQPPYLHAPAAGDLITATVTTQRTSKFYCPGKPFVSCTTTPQITGATVLCGSIATTLDAGSGYISYAWAGPNNFIASAQQTVVNVAGIYTVTVTDGGGCVGTASRQVTAAAAATANISTPNGAVLGCIQTSIPLKCNSGVQYDWAGPNNFSSSSQQPIVSNPGTYTVTVTTAAGCTATATLTVQQDISVPLASISTPGATSLTCVASSMTLQASGGGSYAWSGGLGAGQSISVTQTGTYTVTVTLPGNGCTASATASVTENRALPSITATGGQLTCATGQATLQASSGVAGATFKWKHSSGSTFNGPQPTVSLAGTYTVTVTDPANGCTATQQVVVTPALSVTPVIGSVPAICPGASVGLKASGGFASYHWSSGQMADSITVTQPGIYVVTVTDANQCVGTASVVVTAALTPTPVISGQLSFCTGGSTVLSADLTFDDYLWSNGKQSPAITVTSAGTYTVTVTTSEGCAGTRAVVVTEHPAAVAVLLASQENVCQGQSVTFTAGGGTQYQFWMNGVPQGGFSSNKTWVLNNPASGTVVSVSITDANGCPDSTAVGEGPGREPIHLQVLPIPNLVGASITHLPTCPEDSVRLLLSLPNVPNGPYTVRWQLDAQAVLTKTVSFTNQLGLLLLPPLSPGNHTCKMLSAEATGAGCVANWPTGGNLVQFSTVAPLGAVLDTTICYTQSLTFCGKTYTQSGEYTCPLSSAAGCDSTVVLKLKSATVLEAQRVATICDGDVYAFYGENLNEAGFYEKTVPGTLGCDSLIRLVLTTESPVFDFLSKTVCPGTAYTIGDSTFTQPGTYTIPLKSKLSGCDSTVIFTLKWPSNTPSVSFSGDSLRICGGAAVSLAPVVQHCTNCKYKWSNGATLPSIFVAPTANTTYAVTITDAASGCTATAKVEVVTQAPIFVQRDTLLCSGKALSWCGKAVLLPGDYPCTFLTADGCDSTMTLRVKVYEGDLDARNDSLSVSLGATEQDYEVAEHLLQNDAISGGYELRIVQQPKTDSVVLTEQGETLRYVLRTGPRFGVDSFRYVLCPPNGCLSACDSAWVRVHLQNGDLEWVQAHMPDLVTPEDGDDQNPVFDPLGFMRDQGSIFPDQETVRFYVYNRWGEVVHRPYPYEPWDGSQGRYSLPQATYYYRLRFEIGGEEYELKGPINLLK